MLIKMVMNLQVQEKIKKQLEVMVIYMHCKGPVWILVMINLKFLSG